MMPGLDDMIASLRGLSKLDERTAAIAAPLVERSLQASAAAGSAPDGKAWAPRNKDGGRAMAGAAKAIAVRAFGNVVRVTLTGPEVFHHYGARGEPRRMVIPDTGVAPPAAIQDALDEASARAFAEIVGGQ